MQITRTKKALIAVIALVLVGIFVAVAAVYLPGAENSSAFKDNTVADSGSGADTVSTVSASATAPSEDGTVPDGYQPSGTGISDIATARGDLDGNYHLTDNIRIESLATVNNSDGDAFTGTFDGNGKTITISAASDASFASGNIGGLFGVLQGTVKNCIIVVENFQAKFASGSTWANAGIIAGAGGDNAVVQNVSIILQYSPTSMANGSDNAYLSQYGGQSGKGSAMRLGGVFGNIIGDVSVSDTTVDNQTTGSYGFSTHGWRAGGNIVSSSKGGNYVGGFFGNIQSGSISATRITLAGTASSKIHAYNESADKRENETLVGGILGYAASGKINISGLIITYPINDNDGNLDGTNANKSSFGTVIGHINDAGKDSSVSNAYCLDGVQSAYGNSGGGQSLTAYFSTFASGITPVFVGTSEIAFNGFTKQAPSNASAIVAEITQGGTTQNVMQALIATSESEAGQSVWLTVPYVNATSTAAINLAASYATGSTIALSSDLTFSSGEGIYMASREYNGENVSASIVLGDGRTDLVYSEANANKNVGTHTLTSNIASASGYAYIDYAGTKYVYNTTNKTIYIPQQVAGAAFDVTKALSVEITQRAITVGNLSGNITYGDTVETVQLNNIPEATSGSFVSGEYVESCTISDYVQLETNAGNEEAFNYTSVVIKDASGADVIANYNVTYGEGKAVVKQKTIAGTLSVSNLVYDTTAKTATFALTDGELYNGDAVTITYNGEQTDVTADGFTATATVPNGNYTFGGDNGASISQNFKITPHTVTITAKADRPTSHVYNSGIVSVDDLFDLPVGLLEDEVLSLTLSATKDSVDATVELVGEYKITASLAEGQDNYTAEPVTVDYEVTPYIIEIGVNEEIEKSTVYDGFALTESEMQALFVAPQQVEGAETALTVSVVEGTSVLNAGTYHITATILDKDLDLTRYALKEDVTVEITVEQVVIDGEISAPEDSVYDGSEKFATFVFAEGCEMVGSDEIILTYATQGGQGVTQVVSAGTYTVSAALPAFAAGKSNYKWASEEIATKDIVISKEPVTITANSATAEKQFDGVAFDDYASLFTAPKAVDGITDLVLSYSVGGAAETIVNVGEYTVTATLADNGTNANYEAAEAVVTYTVTPVTVEIIWSENNYAYTGDVQTVSAKYAAVGGEEVDLAVSFGDGVEFRNAGDYLATASFAEGDNEYGNYVLPEVATNTYNIKKADSVIDTENVVKTYTYTGELQTIDSGATLNHSEAELVYSNNTFTTVAEGNGMEVVISVADTANYNGASTTVQITVNKATPAFTVTVEPTEGLFTSSEMPSITADFGENPVVEGVIVWGTDELTAGANAYGWTFTPGDTANYNVVKGSETLNVTAVEMTGIEIKILPDKTDYQYGDKFDKTGMVVEAVYNDGSREIVEDYTVADAYLTTLDENQIEISYNGKTATVKVNVKAKEFAIAYSDLTVVVGSEDFDLATIEASIVGTEGNTVNVAGNDYTYSVAVAYTGAQYDAAAEVGTEYPLTVTVTVTDLDAQYYVGTYEATLRVIATSMEGSWTSESVTAEYDGTAHAAEFNKTVGGEFEIQYAVSGTDVWSTEVPVNAGEYVAKVVSLNEGYSADRLPTATVTITAKQLSVIDVAAQDKEYDGNANITVSGELDGVASGDDVKLIISGTVSDKNVGTDKIVTVSASLDGADKGNYTLNAVSGLSADITAKALTVVWENLTFGYDGQEKLPSASAETGIYGETVTLTVSGAQTNAGTYKATAEISPANANYTLANPEEDYTIEKATPTVNPVAPETAFRQTPLRDISIELTEGDTPGTIAWKNPDYVIDANENVCDWIFTPTDTENYNTLEGSVTLIGKYVVVTRIEIVQTPDKLDYEYGDELDITGLQVQTVYNNGAWNTVDNSKLTVTPNVLTELGEVTVTIKYNSFTTTFNVNVSPKTVTLTWDESASTTVYDGNAYEPAFEATGLVGNDVISLTYEANDGGNLSSGKARNAGSYTATAVLPSDNYVFAQNATTTFDFTIETVKITLEFVGSNVNVEYGTDYDWDIADYYKNPTVANSENFIAEVGFATADDLSGMTTANKDTVFHATLAIAVKDLSGMPLDEADAANFEVVNGEEYTIDLTMTIVAKTLTVVWGELTLEYDGTAQAPTATADTGIDGETVTITVSGAATEPGTYTATASTDNGNYVLTNTSVEYKIVRTIVAAQFTVGYGEITITTDGDNVVEYSVDGGEWATLPEGGKITVELAASWTIRLRFEGETAENSTVVYTSADNVVRLLEENLVDDALLNKDVIEAAKNWLATAVGDKTQAQTKLTEAESAYNAAKDVLAGSVENAFKATANVSDRVVAATVAIATAVTGLGLAAGALAIRRKGGKKNEK